MHHARWVAATYDNARQVVVELDAKLAELVRTQFQVPRAPLVRLRVGDAAQVLPGLSDASRDIIIRDVFAGSTTPVELTTLEYARQVQRVLDVGGTYLANCGDTADLAGARAEAATLSEVFAHVAMVADAPCSRGGATGTSCSWPVTNRCRWMPDSNATCAWPRCRPRSFPGPGCAALLPAPARSAASLRYAAPVLR